MSDAPLAERFGRLWKRMGAADEGRPVFDQVWHAWEEPHRRYHGVDHLRDCLAQLDGAPQTEADRDLAEVALWFHDAVYIPLAPDNEVRSAEWARHALTSAGVSGVRAEEAARLVRLTDHARPATDPTGALVCDVDLSILGRPAPEFAEYERRIRAEYGNVPDALYRAGRTAVLAGFLARDPLYRSEHFRMRYEEPARRNLKRSLEAPGG
ncbi:MAG: HD domain-containing protein [Gemmatimonadales bacterium]